mmetsp:Transcript_31818/g.52437  ORF Transcript_31818/g.52437 Transcript_31818/m.52437 type:complete len:131 (-) Transcript_31818:655-1047(-)
MANLFVTNLCTPRTVLWYLKEAATVLDVFVPLPLGVWAARATKVVTLTASWDGRAAMGHMALDQCTKNDTLKVPMFSSNRAVNTVSTAMRAETSTRNSIDSLMIKPCGLFLVVKALPVKASPEMLITACP